MKSTVFLLEHINVGADGSEDVKTLGIYGTRASAEAAIVRARKRPGFADAPDGFNIDEYVIDEDEWVEGFGITE